MNRDWMREMMTRGTMYGNLLNGMYVDESSTIPMDVDGMDSSTNMFGDVFTKEKEPQDAKFFNRFEDDFDDSDIN
ncbi:hypothetical protein N665_0390s0014 [Sinapis alba]|nr:hypothetical protein N665_0390s0014 [Sinapis alba]